MAEKKVTKKKVVKKAVASKPVKKAAKAAPKAKPVVKPAKAVPKKAAPKAGPLSEVVQKAVKFLDDRKAENIAILDMRPLSSLYDYFIIATAANAPHLKALSDGLQRLCKNEQYEGYRAAGTGDSGWVIVDYDGVMIHVFSFEMRNLYDLEKLWNDAKRIALPKA
ncbi:MAG: ribosome silencing factor [Kiritimatiellaceae bacterium]|nr:ribosome silencing factor [Kiritimatiellaceae bacterium]